MNFVNSFLVKLRTQKTRKPCRLTAMANFSIQMARPMKVNGTWPKS